MNLIDVLLEEGGGFYALFNDHDSMALIFYSKNPIQYLKALFTKSRNNKSLIWKHRKKLEFEVLETCRVAGFDRIKKQLDYTRNTVYTLYPETRVPKLTLHTKLDLKLGVVVSVRDKAYRNLIVGVFGDMDSAAWWIAGNYPGGVVNNIVMREVLET